jgi:hypothetical protein
MAREAKGGLSGHVELFRLGQLDHGTEPSKLHCLETAFLLSVSVRLSRQWSQTKRQLTRLSADEHNLASLSVAHSEYESSIGNGFSSTSAFAQRCKLIRR